MPRWLSSILWLGPYSYELIPADLAKPVPPLSASRAIARTPSRRARESRRCVHAFTARGRRHKGGRIDPGAYDGIAGNHQSASSHNEDARFAILAELATGLQPDVP